MQRVPSSYQTHCALRSLVRHFRRPPLLVFVALWLSLGCGDPRGGGISAPPESPVSSSQLDPAINQSDSWVTADITVSGSIDVTSDEPYLDPTTDATVTSSTEHVQPGDVHFQTGFSSAGAPVAVTLHTPDAGDPDTAAVTVTKIVGDVATDYDAQGRIVPETPSDTLEGPSPLNGLPVIGAQIMIDAFVKPPEDGGGGGGDSCEDCEMGLRASVAPRGLRLGDGSVHVLVRTSRILVIETDLEALPVSSAIAIDPSSHASTPSAKRVRRGYSRRGERWVLDSATVEGEEVVAGKSYRHRSHTRYRNVRFHVNEEKNRIRRRAASGAAMLRDRLTSASRTHLVRGADVRPSVLLQEPPSVATDGQPCTDKIGAVGSSGPSIVFQHGFLSNPCTWDRMEPWVLGDFRFAKRIAMQTPSLKKYDDQALDLRSTIWQTGGTDWVFIGHSNGGIVSRRAAQQESNSFGGVPIRGVLTIGSPHRGAPAMNTALPLVRGFFQAVAAPFKVRLCPQRKRGCSDMWAMTDGSSTIQRIYEFQRDNLGAASQMGTNSPFRGELEAPAENFVRASIVSHAYPKWQWKRMWGDMHCNPEADCGGREAVKRTQRLEKHLKKLAIVYSLGALGSLFLGDPYVTASLAGKALKDASHLAVLHIAEKGYNKWVRGDPDSDGIVPGWSQIYPRTAAAQQFHIQNADSHVGSTKSDKVRAQVRLALRSPVLFNVPAR